MGFVVLWQGAASRREMRFPMVRWEGSHQSLKYKTGHQKSFSVFLKKSPSESERFTIDSAMTRYRCPIPW